MSKKDQFVIEPIDSNEDCGNWNPVVQEETLKFLEFAVPSNAHKRLCEDAISILSKGISPNYSQGWQTGLVVGYVQSGKTMSFETVAALAQDNSFQMVIVITGISTNLLEQSTNRLIRDFQIDNQNLSRRWIHFKNPIDDPSTIQPIQGVLENWKNNQFANSFCPTVLITVMKNHIHLQNLVNLLKRIETQGVPVLIIDDEADQASLNTRVLQRDESTTYNRLMSLRHAIPNHTYLQYTATPQAPLLLNIIDSLSPNFIHVLDAGKGYVGGKEFFDNSSDYVCVIPPNEVPSKLNYLNQPPDSLKKAMRIFMVGVTSGLISNQNKGNRSMLVHPSHKTEQHQEYFNWVKRIFEEWKQILKLPDSDPDRQDFINDFNDAYTNLKRTVDSDIPSFDELAKLMPAAFNSTRVFEVNARKGKTPQVDWHTSYGWILVGGQAMDRGFTIEGLTVTYMPRGIGVGHADTMQQRARFFGYKEQYIGYCRLYLENETITAFRNYVDHEEHMLKELKSIQQNNQPLNDWKRVFILDSRLKPCRNQVLEFKYSHGELSGRYFVPRVILTPESIIEANRKTVEIFLSRNKYVADKDGHPDRTAIQRHEVCHKIPLSEVIENLLVKLRYSGAIDTQRHTIMLIQLSRALENNPNELCSVYKMSSGNTRERQLDDEQKGVKNLFQGESPVHPESMRGSVYPGDVHIYQKENVNIQIHYLDLFSNDNTNLMQRVPVVAIRIPSRLKLALVIQNQQK